MNWGDFFKKSRSFASVAFIGLFQGYPKKAWNSSDFFNGSSMASCRL
jgi:hypothetical protein